MNDPVSKLIIEELGRLLSTASHVLPPVEFAELVIDNNLSDRHLQAIIAAAIAKLKEREVESPTPP